MTGRARPVVEPPLVVGYLRADTPAVARPLEEALIRHAEARGWGTPTHLFRDPASGQDVTRPGFAACLQVCAGAGRAVILVPTPEHLAGNALLTGALLSQARGVRAAVTYLDGRPATRPAWASDQATADPALAPAVAPPRATPPPAPPLR